MPGQLVTITFCTLPWVPEHPQQMRVTIERHAKTHDQAVELVKAANALGAIDIQIIYDDYVGQIHEEEGHSKRV